MAKLSFTDFLKVYEAYAEYNKPEPTPQPDLLLAAIETLTNTVNQLRTPAPSVEPPKPVTIDDVVNKLLQEG